MLQPSSVEALLPPARRVSSYFAELCQAMNLVARQPNVIFMGQAVAVEGTAMRKTLLDVPAEKLLELPVFEDCQLGMAIGMSLAGMLPVCIFPRWNFLLLAANQLVLHLDKLYFYSNGGYRPKVIIRTAVATDKPLDPGSQHLGDFSEAFRSMLKTVVVDCLHHPHQIIPAYQRALIRDESTILVEYASEYV
jgi:pyruvate/2-oxoglutarate/acetoin dehydrogenase E1 component